LAWKWAPAPVLWFLTLTRDMQWLSLIFCCTVSRH
jgi:hypothetical protein